MPNPNKGETQEAYIARFMSSEEAKKSFPDEKQRYAVALSMWKKRGKKTDKDKAEVKAMSNLEMRASISDAEVTEEIVQKYGLSLKDIDQSGYHLIEGELMYLDQPCAPVVDGELKDKVKTFIFDSNTASEFLASLKNKPLHINGALDGHYDVDATGQKVHKVVGSLLGGRIDTKDDGSKVIMFLGGLFDKSMPNEVATIKARKNDLGASFELYPTAIDIDTASLIGTVKGWIYKGAAILQKTFAAFPETSLLIAQEGAVKANLSIPLSSMVNMLKTMGDMDINEKDMDQIRDSMSGKNWQKLALNQATEGRHNMDADKIYTQAELDEAIAKAAEAAKASLEAQTKAEEVLKAKDTEITELKAQAAAKDSTIVTMTDKVKVLETEKTETVISAQVDKWWTDNSKFYEEKDKETILNARKAVLKGGATPEQIDSMITARKAEKTEIKKPADLLGSGAPAEGADIDMRHGVRTKDGFKRTK